MAPGKTVHNGENRRKMDALTIRYYDSLAADLDAGVEISPRGYVYFLCHLTDLSAEVSDQIKDVKAYLDKEQGFTLSDGLWWYRKAGPDAAKGEWTVLTSGAVYDQMLVEVEKKTEWIEVQHSQQRDRDARLEDAAKKAKVDEEEEPAVVAVVSAAPAAVAVVVAAPAPSGPAAEESPFAVWERYVWPPLIVDGAMNKGEGAEVEEEEEEEEDEDGGW